MSSENVRELARKHPQDFRNVAERCDGQLGEHLKKVLEEETGGGEP